MRYGSKITARSSAGMGGPKLCTSSVTADVLDDAHEVIGRARGRTYEGRGDARPGNRTVPVVGRSPESNADV
jgi:hypothetical protein